MALNVNFYRLQGGKEPVRDWLKKLPAVDRKLIGQGIKTVQWGWPLGMPLVRSLGDGLWEVRTKLKGRIARIIFCAQDDHIVLLHGFMKKKRKTSDKDIQLAKQRMKEL